MRPKKKKDNYRKGTTVSKGNSGKSDFKEESKKKDDTTLNKNATPKGPHNPDDDTEPETGKEFPIASTSFARREIVSNWSRYEDDGQWPADGEDSNFDDQFKRNVSIGIDFEVALNAASEVGEQFRFREEKEWDKFDEEEGNGHESFVYSSLDVEDQVLTLSCIPLPQKLDVDPKYFTQEMIKQYEEIALSNQTRLAEKRTMNSISTKEETNKNHIDTTEFENVVQKSELQEEEDELDVLLNMAEYRSKAHVVANTCTSTSIVPASETTSRVETQSQNNNPSDIQSLEDWLDTVILD